MKSWLFIFTGAVALLFSCSTEEVARNYSIKGTVQKGPFINGSQILIAELEKGTLSQTGKSFSTETINDMGEFEMENILLNSDIVEITASGFYYNEVGGFLSAAPLTLKSVAQLNDNSTVNVNLLTNITIDRIKNLMGKGQDFLTAKAKAENEILGVFKAVSNAATDFERLDISSDSEDDALLISISSVFQGNNSVAELSKLLADFKDDFETDGTIDDVAIQAELINNAVNINKVFLRSNLENQYKALGKTITVPGFEQYLDDFITKSGFGSTIEITYSNPGKYGVNILSLSSGQEILKDTQYSLAATYPSGISLLIKLKMNITEGAVTWIVDNTKIENWNAAPVAGSEITGQKEGGSSDMPITFTNTCKIEIQIATFKAGITNEYIGTKTIQLTIK